MKTITEYRIGDTNISSQNRKIEEKKIIETYKGYDIYSINAYYYEIGYTCNGKYIIQDPPLLYAHYDMITVEKQGKQIFRRKRCDIKIVKSFITRYQNNRSRIKKENLQLKMFKIEE